MTSLSPLVKPAYLSDNLKYRGKWRLNKDHDLELAVTGNRDRGEEVITLKGDIVSIASDELLFLITSKKEENIEVSRLLKLSGKWQADEFNRLGFAVSKEDGDDDVLVFDGKWEIGGNNEIIYRYKKTRLARRTKEERQLVFKGFWQIAGKNRLAYLLDSSGDSVFLFTAQLEGPSIVGNKGALQYKVGIGVSRPRRAAETVIKFFGTVRYNLTKKDALVLELAGRRGESLGICVGLDKKILGAEAFLRFRKLAEESRIEVGIRIPW